MSRELLSLFFFVLRVLGVIAFGLLAFRVCWFVGRPFVKLKQVGEGPHGCFAFYHLIRNWGDGLRFSGWPLLIRFASATAVPFLSFPGPNRSTGWSLVTSLATLATTLRTSRTTSMSSLSSLTWFRASPAFSFLRIWPDGGQRDTSFGTVNFLHPNIQDIAYRIKPMGIADIPVGKPADVYKTTLPDPDIQEHAEIDDIDNLPSQLHSLLEIIKLQNAFAENRSGQILTGIVRRIAERS